MLKLLMKSTLSISFSGQEIMSDYISRSNTFVTEEFHFKKKSNVKVTVLQLRMEFSALIFPDSFKSNLFCP